MSVLDCIHLGFCSFWIVSVLDCVCSGLCPFWTVSIRDCVISESYPFGMVSIRNGVLSEWCTFGMVSFGIVFFGNVSFGNVSIRDRVHSDRVHSDRVHSGNCPDTIFTDWCINYSVRKIVFVVIILLPYKVWLLSYFTWMDKFLLLYGLAYVFFPLVLYCYYFRNRYYRYSSHATFATPLCRNYQ